MDTGNTNLSTNTPISLDVHMISPQMANVRLLIEWIGGEMRQYERVGYQDYELRFPVS